MRSGALVPGDGDFYAVGMGVYAVRVLVSWCPGFLVSWFPGFLVSWFLLRLTDRICALGISDRFQTFGISDLFILGTGTRIPYGWLVDS
jgi:hypothetical protein